MFFFQICCKVYPWSASSECLLKDPSENFGQKQIWPVPVFTSPQIFFDLLFVDQKSCACKFLKIVFSKNTGLIAEI